MTQEEVNKVIQLHDLWLEKREGGKRADFRGVKLWGVDLGGAYLEEACLVGANLWAAKLQGARLGKTDLRGANLVDTDLRGVSLEKANLGGAYLRGAKNIFRFNKQEGRECFAIVHDSCLMIHAGCFWGSLDEFEAKATKENAGYEAQIAYLRALEKMYCKQ